MARAGSIEATFMIEWEESGAAAAPPAVSYSLLNGLWMQGVHGLDMPATPESLRRELAAAP